MPYHSGAPLIHLGGLAASLLAFTGALPHTVAAQGGAPPRARAAVSFAFAQTRPVGELGRNIGAGYGAAAAFLLPITHSGSVSLRADIGASQYGEESRRTAFSESVGDRVEVKVKTANNYVPASVGLQLTLPTGPVLPYVNAGVGLQAFYTESRVEPTSGGYALVSTINQSDLAAAWTLGGGVYVPLRAAGMRAMLDLSAQYVHGGTAQYLAPGSIIDLPNGRVRVTPMESSTHLVSVRLGARFGL